MNKEEEETPKLEVEAEDAERSLGRVGRSTSSDILGLLVSPTLLLDPRNYSRTG